VVIILPEKDDITVEEIEQYKDKSCPLCPFHKTSYCSVSNDDVRDCIIIDAPIEV
jgi:hypothetical protein